MNDFAGIFEVLASDQHDARLASRKALVLSRDRIDARLGKFLAASKSAEEFDARYALVADDFEGIVRVAANEVGHEDPNALIETLHSHYREAGKPPWLKDDGEDDEPGEDDDKDDKDDHKAPPFGKKDAGDGEDDEDDDDHDPMDSPEGDSESDHHWTDLQRSESENDDKDDKKESKTAAPGGNTGLAGPSPTMDKKRWSPKSVKPIDVPSERHPTVQKDILEVMPKKNEGPPGDAHNLDEIWSLTTTETLPTATGLDDAGFAGNNQDMAPHTKTFGDGGQADPVRSESLEA